MQKIKAGIFILFAGTGLLGCSSISEQSEGMVQSDSMIRSEAERGTDSESGSGFEMGADNEAVSDFELESDREKADTMKLYVNGKEFSAELYDNLTAEQFMELLPMQSDMQNLNGNEKYFYMDEKLVTNEHAVEMIYSGDIMLYGDNCIVIFYKGFGSNYSYTPIGKVKDADWLSEVFKEEGNISVSFSRGACEKDKKLFRHMQADDREVWRNWFKSVVTFL